MSWQKSRLRREDGDVKAGSIVMILVIVIAIFIGWRMIPHWIAYYNMEDFIAEQVKYSSGQSRNIQELTDRIFNKSREFDIPLKKEAIAITWEPTRISIKTTWTVEIDLVVYRYVKTFVILREGPLFG